MRETRAYFEIALQLESTIKYANIILHFPGSSIYSLLISKGFTAGETLRMSVCIIGVSLFVCAIFASPDRDTNSIRIIYFAFVTLEVAIGMYFPGRFLW